MGFNGEIYALTVYYRNREIALTIIPSDAPPAAEIQTVDLRNRSDEDFDEIHRAWLDHLVILFRRQQLAIEDLIAFSRRFGELDWAPVQETGRRFVAGHPEIYVFPT